MGPCVIFDKSFLQALNPDQAVIFDLLYQTNVVPVLFIEILADLAKEEARGRKPEEVTAGLAAKAPSMQVYLNAPHAALCVGEMFGQPVRMEGRPVIQGGQHMQADGREGTVFDLPGEIEAMLRWSDQRFTEGERTFAAAWREGVNALDLDRLAREFVPRSPVKTLEQAREEAARIVRADGSRFRLLKRVFDMLGVLPEHRSAIIARWKAAGGPALPEFAPYAAHVVTVQVFFGLALSKGFIAKERPSNQMDMAYLFYLPFCDVFVSGDKLHARTAPLFLRADQRFVRSEDLKADLAVLDTHYSAMEEVKTEGLFSLVPHPPKEGQFLAQELWDLARPDWRTDHSAPIPITPELNAAIMKHLRPVLDGMKDPKLRQPVVEGEKGDFSLLTRRVPTHRGKWQVLPAGLKDAR